MLIHPIGIVSNKLFRRSGKHSKGNPLGNLALESTAILFIGLSIAYELFKVQPGWLYPIMLMIIGVGYLIFQTIYGMKIYWILGLILMGAGIIGLNLNQIFFTCALLGGMIELLFSIVIIQRNRKKYKC